MLTPERTGILQVDVHTQNSHVRIDLAEDLEIDTSNIMASYTEQPGKFAYWATVALQAKFAYERKKQEVNRQEDYLKKTLWGQLDIAVRHQMELDGEKITEAKVTNNIYVHKDYVSNQEKLYTLQDELLRLQEQYYQLDAAKEAMEQRKDILISVGAQLRMENSNTD